MRKFSLLQKMTLSALLLAANIIITRFLGIYITPYVRFSFGVSVSIFSSILLGPLCGSIIYGCADIFGILIYNSSGVAINPFYTISCFLMGAIPGLIYMFRNKVKLNDKKSFVLLNAVMLLILVGIIIFSVYTTKLNIFRKELILNVTAKILIPIISFVVLILIDLFAIFLNKHFKKKREIDDSIPSVYLTLLIVLIIEVIFTLFLNSLIKSLFYQIQFEIIFFPALLLSFIYIPVNTLVVSYLCLLASKTIVVR